MPPSSNGSDYNNNGNLFLDPRDAIKSNNFANRDSKCTSSIDEDHIKLFEDEIVQDIAPTLKMDSLESDKVVLSS